MSADHQIPLDLGQALTNRAEGQLHHRPRKCWKYLCDLKGVIVKNLKLKKINKKRKHSKTIKKETLIYDHLGDLRKLKSEASVLVI